MKLLHPLPGARITQRFGEHPEWYAPTYEGHEGLDFSAVVGAPVRAAHAGVVWVRESDGYGTYIELMGDGIRTVYAHLSTCLEGSNVTVDAGAVIALTGNTGNSTGPHLHFGVCPLPRDWANGYQGYVDPEPWLKQEDDMNWGPFIASYQTGAESGPSVDVVAASDMPYVGQIFEGMPFAGPLWTGPRAKRVFARFWVEGAGLKGDAYERTFMVRGAAGAEDYVAILRERYEAAKALGIVDVKGPNEPHPIDVERPAHMAFWLRWVDLLRGMGLRPWVMCWSSGTPPIEEVGYWVPAIRAARAAGGGLSAHHYNAPHLLNDPYHEWPQYGDAWYSRRFELIIDALYSAGLERGEGWYLISECGIDGNGIDWKGDPAFQGKRKRLGWRDWADWLVNWTTYKPELEQYAQYVAAWPEVLAVELFVSHPREEWKSYNYDVEQLEWMGARWAGFTPDAPPEPPTDLEQIIGDAVQWHIIPLNPNAALEKAGAALGLLPASDEVRDVAGYVAQAFRRAGEEAIQHIAYCADGDWGNITWFERAN